MLRPCKFSDADTNSIPILSGNSKSCVGWEINEQSIFNILTIKFVVNAFGMMAASPNNLKIIQKDQNVHV